MKSLFHPTVMGALALTFTVSCKEPPPPPTQATPEEIAAMEAEFEAYDIAAQTDGGYSAGTLGPQPPEQSSEAMPDGAPTLTVEQVLSITAPPNRPPVSFTKQVAAILVSNCRECHIDDDKGDLDFTSFATLMKGSQEGPVVIAGKPEDSPLIAKVASGEMPAEGDALTAEQIETLRSWIARGARFDGEDSATPLIELLPAKSEAPEEESKETQKEKNPEDAPDN